MARHVKISVISCTAHPPSTVDSADAAIAHLRAQIDQVLPECPDVIVLPEFSDMCSAHGIAQYKETQAQKADRVLDSLSDLARESRSWITYPSLRQNGGNEWRNSVRLLNRQGEVAGTYDKNFLTISEIEQGITPGNDVSIVETDFGRVTMAICFDLNFDQLRQTHARLEPDLILFCSMYHGGLMQAYWAYSCRAHFAAAVSGLPGGIVSPVGHSIAVTTNYFNHITATVNLDCRVAHLDDNADKLLHLKQKYGANVRIFDPGLLAPVLVSSEMADKSIDDLFSEFGIEDVDSYFRRCRSALKRA